MFRPVAIACALPFVLVACAAEEPALEEIDPELVAATTLTEKHDGQTASFNEGQSVIVALASNPSTGYDWEVTKTDKSFGYPTKKYVKSSSKVGAGGTTKLTWATKSPIGSLVGTHTVELSYKRASDTTASKVVTFQIEVLAAGTPKPVRLSDADNKKAVTATAGQDVVVTLASNPTTGYKWEVASTDKTFGYPTESYAASSNATGSGGFQSFTWKTKGALPMTGKHTVALDYKRSWENAALKTFTFSVTIK